MRFNLDLFDEYSDENLCTALSLVKLKDIISEMPAVPRQSGNLGKENGEHNFLYEEMRTNIFMLEKFRTLKNQTK